MPAILPRSLLLAAMVVSVGASVPREQADPRPAVSDRAPPRITVRVREFGTGYAVVHPMVC